MESGAYHERLAALVRNNAVPESTIDEAVRRVLRVKFALGIFDHPYVDENRPPYQATPEKRALARKAAEESIVLLQNRAEQGQPKLLPISNHVHTIALIDQLADCPRTAHEQPRRQASVCRRYADFDDSRHGVRCRKKSC